MATTTPIGAPWIALKDETTIIKLSSPSSGFVNHFSVLNYLITFGLHSVRANIWLNTSNDPKLDTGGTVWHAALCLSRYILDNIHVVKGRHVLELGSGCGLVGLVAAAAGSY